MVHSLFNVATDMWACRKVANLTGSARSTVLRLLVGIKEYAPGRSRASGANFRNFGVTSSNIYQTLPNSFSTRRVHVPPPVLVLASRLRFGGAGGACENLHAFFADSFSRLRAVF